MGAWYNYFDLWLEGMLKDCSAENVRYFEFRIFKNEDYLSCADPENEDYNENLWDLQLVGLGDAPRPLFSTKNDFYTFEADPDWDDPAEIVTDIVHKYLCDGKTAQLLRSAPEGIWVSLPELREGKQCIVDTAGFF